MPHGPAPERYRDLLESKALGHLASVDAKDRPQVNPVWFISDGAFIYLSVKPETAKYRNLRANPAVALSILDPGNSGRYLELRGTVTAFELYEDLTWVNQLAHKYTGADFTNGVAGEQRYKVTIRVDSWTG
jgi:PPOX class probable F420-dependent enzyme